MEKQNQNLLLIAVVVFVVVIFASAIVDSITGEAVRWSRWKSKSSYYCRWIDRYGHPNLDIEKPPIDEVCSKVLGWRYKPVAYELRSDFVTYMGPGCSSSKLISITYDHHIVESYGAKTPNIGENVGLDVCRDTIDGNSAKTFKAYDGVLCCR